MTDLKYETYIGHPAVHYSMLSENDFDKIKVLFIKIVYDFRYKSRASARNKKKLSKPSYVLVRRRMAMLNQLKN